MGLKAYYDDDYYKKCPNHGPQKHRWGSYANRSINNVDDQHDDVLRSRIARKKIGKNLTIGGAALGGAALIGTGAYLIHRHNKKKKESEKKNELNNERKN